MKGVASTAMAGSSVSEGNCTGIATSSSSNNLAAKLGRSGAIPSGGRAGGGSTSILGLSYARQMICSWRLRLVCAIKERAKEKAKEKAKAKVKAKEKVKTEKAKGKEKRRMGSLREKERGRLDSVILAKSGCINHSNAGTTRINGMDLRLSQKQMTGLSHGTDLEMLLSSQLEENHLLGNLIKRGANT